MNLRDAVLKQPKTKLVDAFGQTVTVSEIGALDRIEYIEYLQKLQADGVSNERVGVLLSVFLMVKSAVEDGQRVFEDDEVETLAASNIDLDDVSKVFQAAAELNGLLAGGND